MAEQQSHSRPVLDRKGRGAGWGKGRGTEVPLSEAGAGQERRFRKLGWLVPASLECHTSPLHRLPGP